MEGVGRMASRDGPDPRVECSGGDAARGVVRAWAAAAPHPVQVPDSVRADVVDWRGRGMAVHAARLSHVHRSGVLGPRGARAAREDARERRSGESAHLAPRADAGRRRGGRPGTRVDCVRVRAGVDRA